jgi:hypothetical protein
MVQIKCGECIVKKEKEKETEKKMENKEIRDSF